MTHQLITEIEKLEQLFQFEQEGLKSTESMKKSNTTILMIQKVVEKIKRLVDLEQSIPVKPNSKLLKATESPLYKFQKEMSHKSDQTLIQLKSMINARSVLQTGQNAKSVDAMVMRKIAEKNRDNMKLSERDAEEESYHSIDHFIKTKTVVGSDNSLDDKDKIKINRTRVIVNRTSLMRELNDKVKNKITNKDANQAHKRKSPELSAPPLNRRPSSPKKKLSKPIEFQAFKAHKNDKYYDHQEEKKRQNAFCKDPRCSHKGECKLNDKTKSGNSEERLTNFLKGENSFDLNGDGSEILNNDLGHFKDAMGQSINIEENNINKKIDQNLRDSLEKEAEHTGNFVRKVSYDIRKQQRFQSEEGGLLSEIKNKQSNLLLSNDDKAINQNFNNSLLSEAIPASRDVKEYEEAFLSNPESDYLVSRTKVRSSKDLTEKEINEFKKIKAKNNSTNDRNRVITFTNYNKNSLYINTDSYVEIKDINGEMDINDNYRDANAKNQIQSKKVNVFKNAHNKRDDYFTLVSENKKAADKSGDKLVNTLTQRANTSFHRLTTYKDIFSSRGLGVSKGEQKIRIHDYKLANSEQIERVDKTPLKKKNTFFNTYKTEDDKYGHSADNVAKQDPREKKLTPLVRNPGIKNLNRDTNQNTDLQTNNAKDRRNNQTAPLYDQRYLKKTIQHEKITKLEDMLDAKLEPRYKKAKNPILIAKIDKLKNTLY